MDHKTAARPAEPDAEITVEEVDGFDSFGREIEITTSTRTAGDRSTMLAVLTIVNGTSRRTIHLGAGGIRRLQTALHVAMSRLDNHQASNLGKR
jgi:hypothetical protein